MNSLKQYFKEEIKLRMIALEHPKPSDFYLSAWQTTRSSVPLLIWRTLLFLTSLGVVLSSAIIYIINGLFGYWFIYLTHWGLTINVLATGFATAVSLRCYFYGPISADLNIPWYVKTYWVFYNIATPMAFLITIFYWTLLYEAGIEEELNHGLDVAVHGVNSLVMFFLLVSSSHPSRILHIYQPLIFAVCYVFFGIFYHLAGGTDRKGNQWIYSVVNWANPGHTAGVVALTGLLLILLHIIVVGIATGRDVSSKALLKPSVTVHIEEGMSLRQPTQTQN